jgi:hypothetical protein
MNVRVPTFHDGPEFHNTTTAIIYRTHQPFIACICAGSGHDSQDVTLLRQEVSSAAARTAESQERLTALRVQHHLIQREAAVLRGQVCSFEQSKAQFSSVDFASPG